MMGEDTVKMDNYPLTVFYDGACPICAREMALMKRLDRTQCLTLVDFSPAGFDAAPAGLVVADLSTVIHAQWADGTVMTGVEVFRAIWEAVGLGFLARMSRLPVIDPLTVKAYAWFARNRLWLTGRYNACPGNTCAAASSKPARTSQ